MNIVVMVAVFFLMLFLKSSLTAPFSSAVQSLSLALGFIMIFAFLTGKNANKLRLPQITGFILAGIICGPYLMNLLNAGEVQDLRLLDGLALSLIALTAGGEMDITKIKGSLKAIFSITFFQSLIIMAGFILLGVGGRSLFPFFAQMTGVEVLVISFLLGTLATATSPSTTIAIITETRASGKYTDLVLSTAVVKDFVVIVFFALALSFSKSIIIPTRTFDTAFLYKILSEIGGSILLGGIVGLGIILYLRYIKKDITIFILGVSFFTYQISHSFGLHPLLVCLLAGFLVKNFSSQGERLISAIEKSSLPVYIVFFAIAGASIDLEALRQSWLLALVVVIWRGVLKFSGTYIGGKLAKEDRLVQRKSWAGFISQAGVALGMVVIIERTFPSWGGEFKTLVLAVIGINQIIGPVLLQKFLVKAGETGKKET
ncbi:MAG: cation:proton antiporter [Candidatus Aminicenantes bacterium]